MQASSALHHVRQHIHPEIPIPPWMKASANPSLVGSQTNYLDGSYVPQVSGSTVFEVVKGSKLRARSMVDTAIKV